MRKNFRSLAVSSLAIAVAIPGGQALAQSTGSVDFEETIVVTGTRAQAVAGVNIPDTPKAKQVLDQTFIAKQVPGQSINDIINMVPGVSFSNNDPFGSAGGKLFIRGFDNTRISQTVDGVPLNDTGGYALYSSQQLDPELIEQVNVNLGSTDVDSPTAAATGSTVNYRSRVPTEDFHSRVMASTGDFNFFRIFGVIDTGTFTSFGTRAWLSASQATNDAIYGGIGKIEKRQFNAKIYQPIGDNGDFISVAGHWNRARNNQFASVPLYNNTTTGRVVGSGSTNRYPVNSDEQFFQTARCVIPAGVSGAADSLGCGDAWEFRYNPSDTGNIRVNSRFTLAEGLVLSVDPNFQYVKANGGGTVSGREGFFNSGGTAYTGFFGGQYWLGRDLNNDRDTLDTCVQTATGGCATGAASSFGVRLLAPSQTQTYRLGLISSLRYDINDTNTVRIAYSYDRGRHLQTGELGYLQENGFGADPFPVDQPITDAAGNVIQKRNRLSYAILHQVSGEYRGKFFDEAITFTAGLRAPFFKRNLTNRCFVTAANGNVNCIGSAALDATYAAANPTFARPQQRIFKYDKLLPNVGATFAITPQASLFANYSKGLQVPGTDNLYQSFWFAPTRTEAQPDPETTDNFDVGVRFRQGSLLAQLSGWYTIYSNRLASSYDRELNETIYRNLGKVDKYGVDGSVSYAPIPELNFYVFGSYLKSKIKDNVESGNCSELQARLGLLGCTLPYSASTPQAAFLQTAGKRESGAPVYTFGGRIDGKLGPLELGIQAKRTGPRYVNDQNLPFYNSTTTVPATAALFEIFPAKAPAYTLVDISARLPLSFTPLGDKTFLQLNVSNVFDEFYVGGFDGTSLSYTASGSPTFGNLGTPRTFIATLNVGF
ncbi:MAG: TonB-dependent receptor [Sphingobium sp.]